MSSKPAIPLPQHVDVLVVGAGLSGIGAARTLRVEHPELTFALLEARPAIGGTWDLFRYPGLRSDSDMYSLGYDFKPWTAPEAIASGQQILEYLHEALDENDLRDRVWLNTRVRSMAWSSGEARWRVTVDNGAPGATSTMTAGWIFHAGGYYRYDGGHAPTFEGQASFAGPIVHPQTWPQDLDYRGKRIAVIGSGATAVTLLPALAATAAHVTMVQRTPSYVMPVPARDKIALLLRRILGDRRGHALARRKSLTQQRLIVNTFLRFPRAARHLVRLTNARLLPDGYEVDVHFNPPYDPWQQRLCAVPDGDLFAALSDGSASIATGQIARIAPEGIVMRSGEAVAADVIVTATGLRMRLFDGIDIEVDGDAVDVSDRLTYKGMMLSGVPNLAYAFGGTVTWTVRMTYVYRHFSKLLSLMRADGLETCVPQPAAHNMEQAPLITLSSGYFQRAADNLPRQGDRDPWQSTRDWKDDRRLLDRPDVTDPELLLARRTAPSLVRR